jgi:hypothetical protein
MHLGNINLEAIPSGMDQFSKMLNTMMRAKQMSAQTQSINLRNQYYPQQMQEQLEQMQLKNAYQGLINKYYPELTQARIGQMGSMGAAGGTPLMRSYSTYMKYLKQYGPNHPITKGAKQAYDLSFKQVSDLNASREKLTQLAKYRFSPGDVKEGMDIAGMVGDQGGADIPGVMGGQGITPSNNPIDMSTQQYFTQKPPIQPLVPKQKMQDILGNMPLFNETIW